jgi:hypothetical protein
VVQINGRYSLSPEGRRLHLLQRLIRSRSDDHRLQTAILGKRLGMQAFKQGHTGRKRIIRNGVAIFVVALLGLAVRLLSG